MSGNIGKAFGLAGLIIFFLLFGAMIFGIIGFWIVLIIVILIIISSTNQNKLDEIKKEIVNKDLVFKCINCKTKISGNEKYCPKCGVEVTTEIVCPRCKKINPLTNSFCSECGHSISKTKLSDKWKCDKCGKVFSSQSLAEKHEVKCNGK